MADTEQKLRLSASNVISIITVLGSLILTYSTLSTRIAVLEKQSTQSEALYGKMEFKLDKIIESTNQIKVDMAGQRVKNAEKTN